MMNLPMGQKEKKHNSWQFIKDENRITASQRRFVSNDENPQKEKVLADGFAYSIRHLWLYNTIFDSDEQKRRIQWLVEGFP